MLTTFATSCSLLLVDFRLSMAHGPAIRHVHRAWLGGFHGPRALPSRVTNALIRPTAWPRAGTRVARECVCSVVVFLAALRQDRRQRDKISDGREAWAAPPQTSR